MQTASASQGRQKRRNELVVVEEGGSETVISIPDLGHRTVATQTDITGPVLQQDESIPRDVEIDKLEGYTNKQLQAWLRERSWSVKGNKSELVARIIHAINVDGPTDSATSACDHSTVRAGANATHAWKKCTLCGKITWKMNKASKELEVFTGAVGVQEVIDSMEKSVEETAGIYIAKAGKDIIGYMVPDTGCKKSVAGVHWHRAMRTKLKKECGLKPIPVKLDTGFRFGDGREVRASKAWRYPCSLQGKVFCLEVAEINEACPPLLSIDAMRELGCDLRISDDTASLSKVGVLNTPLDSADSGHPLLKLWEVCERTRFPREYHVGVTCLATTTEGLATIGVHGAGCHGDVCATECLDVHEVQKKLLAFLDTRVIPLTSTRTNLGGAARTLCLGAYTRRGVGVTVATQDYKELVGLTRAWLQKEQPHATFTTLSVSQMGVGNLLKVHRDQNTGTSWVRALGEFHGGQLWIAGKGNRTAPPELLPLPKDCPEEGQLVDLTSAWFCLDASQYHGVCKIESGVRYSISAYICKDPHKLSCEHWRDLSVCGFATGDIREQKVSELPRPVVRRRVTLQQ
eukprot:6465659-Amphidinium_carterae.2